MAKAKKPKGFTPSPFFSSWWGSLADRVWRVTPLKRKLSSRSEIPHKTQEDKTPEEKCPCQAFTMCDQRYQDMDPIVKDAWRFCVKKRGMSGYGLFMKECLCLLIAGYNFPRTCSPSGGYNCITVDPICEALDIEGFIGQAHVRYRCLGPPEWKCCPSPQGAYETLEACQAVCRPPVENTCNDCDPQIPDRLYVTFAGLQGDFAPYNGKHAVDWLSGCIWQKNFPPPPAPPESYIALFTAGHPNTYWSIDLSVNGVGCFLLMEDDTAPGTMICEPWAATYTRTICNDYDCGDSDSCEDSIAATVSVSPF